MQLQKTDCGSGNDEILCADKTFIWSISPLAFTTALCRLVVIVVSIPQFIVDYFRAFENSMRLRRCII